MLELSLPDFTSGHRGTCLRPLHIFALLCAGKYCNTLVNLHIITPYLFLVSVYRDRRCSLFYAGLDVFVC